MHSETGCPWALTSRLAKNNRTLKPTKNPTTATPKDSQSTPKTPKKARTTDAARNWSEGKTHLQKLAAGCGTPGNAFAQPAQKVRGRLAWMIRSSSFGFRRFLPWTTTSHRSKPCRQYIKVKSHHTRLRRKFFSVDTKVNG